MLNAVLGAMILGSWGGAGLGVVTALVVPAGFRLALLLSSTLDRLERALADSEKPAIASAVAKASRYQPVQPFGECICVGRAFAIQDAGGIQEKMGEVAPQRLIFGRRDG